MTEEKVFQKLKTERVGKQVLSGKLITEAEFQIRKLAFKKSLAWWCTHLISMEKAGASAIV